jgi:hypothetical protein
VAITRKSQLGGNSGTLLNEFGIEKSKAKNHVSKSTAGKMLNFH